MNKKKLLSLLLLPAKELVNRKLWKNVGKPPN